ncbi:thioesterase II family protein [Streptomyces tendae]|uniref:thioesterase II family protein n=1 Tax=Streptomyces tendae TaxID=1932 RepID=UPI0036B42974
MTAAPAQSQAWVRRYRPAPDAAVRLVCFPHAGGSATFYYPVAQALAPVLDVLAVQYPGRQDRHTEPPVDDIHVLADVVTEELVADWNDRPLLLFGHSMGAMVAYEVACRLQRRGTVPVGLFASGRRAPSTYRDENVHLADDEGLVAEMRRMQGTDAQVFEDEEILRMILPAVRSDYRAVETYRHQPAPPLSCPVVALNGRDDPQVTPQEAQAWESHTASGFRLLTYPGGHFYLSAQAPEVLREIREFALTAAPAGTGGGTAPRS